MSYRDTRNCVEMLRTIGYPRQLSMENFRTSNFPLIASILLYLAKRFEPETEFPANISTEEDRVALIRQIAQFMAVKANIKLNTKRLYQADGYAVKEILKIASLLYNSLTIDIATDPRAQQDEDDAFTTRDFDIADKFNDLKQSRQFATEITLSGASLFELLGKEMDVRAIREASISKQFDVGDVGTQVQQAIDSIRDETDRTTSEMNNITATEANLDAKIERRGVEIERYEKRLLSLKKVRPAFLEEFLTLETELSSLFSVYSSRMRSLVQLEKLAAEAERAQIQRAQNASLQRPSTTTIPLEAADDELIFEEPITQDMKIIQRKAGDRKAPSSRLDLQRARTGGRTRLDYREGNPSVAKAYGGQTGFSNSTSSLEITSDSEDDELFLDRVEPELADVPSDDDSLGLEFSGLDRNKRAVSGRVTNNKIHMQDNSDEDF